MKSLLKLLILSLITSSYITLSATANDKVIERDKAMHKVTKSLKCLVCNGESVYDSNSNFAIAMREFIRSELEQGRDEEQIINDVVSAYGEEILLSPFFSLKTTWLWLLPGLLLILGFYKLFTNKNLLRMEI
ncbi:MAG: cytochrome c-type biogenesis protein CcmH [Candidatus Midichloria sp.]|uniref:Cytochrome C biogenesis protein n=1 Tax=Hyalomma marginatum TaxID=34627 RepID=A0A8S4C4C4_9ACAR|nr:cytochrome C biogenesis protein [Hyalomma marginatum]CAG7599179.1 cytochrome C biogenesis protein [Hyalomma marginatum]